MPRYFSPEADRALYVCSETGETGINEVFVEDLDQLRYECGFPFTITSGYRSPRHSAEANKARPGTHTQGIAADIYCIDSAKRRTIVEKAIELGFGGIGIAHNFVHVDTRITTQYMWIY
jgi:uncharacterized protein YcbK (DUF882 family)